MHCAMSLQTLVHLSHGAAIHAVLTFKNRASYILDGRTNTLQMMHFIYFFNKYKYRVF